MFVIDEACRLLQKLAQDEGLGGIEVYVRSDGRVTITRYAPDGFYAKCDRADVLPGSALPLPSEVFE